MYYLDTRDQQYLITIDADPIIRDPIKWRTLHSGHCIVILMRDFL